ncbi:MAG: hypothetical protein Q8Q08_11065 [Candidatus Omnitrophota bacterium]|nr:hypothetical protein [Candidatus Omnitrophota bacterium]MDZ4241222.1 hypothetical protein [Candidatus Omnitrophota bacterium]
MQDQIQSKDQLQETLEKVGTMQDQFIRTNLGVDEKASKALKSLRNPFIPQLPQEKPKPPDKKDPPPRLPPVSDNQIDQRPTYQPPVAQQTPEPQPAASVPNFVISGMVWNSSRPQAIVNGKVVEIGASLDGWDVTNISEGGVTFRQGDVTLSVIPVARTEGGSETRSRDSRYETPRLQPMTPMRNR